MILLQWKSQSKGQSCSWAMELGAFRIAVPVLQLAQRGAGLLSLPSPVCCLSVVTSVQLPLWLEFASWRWKDGKIEFAFDCLQVGFQMSWCYKLINNIGGIWNPEKCNVSKLMSVPNVLSLTARKGSDEALPAQPPVSRHTTSLDCVDSPSEHSTMDTSLGLFRLL